MSKIDKEIEDYISRYGLSPEDLTDKEMKQVTDEVKRLKDGETILDSVLMSIPIYR